MMYVVVVVVYLAILLILNMVSDNVVEWAPWPSQIVSSA